jgi:HPt (histidine-containing phosphotransfer) domain-containing protein
MAPSDSPDSYVNWDDALETTGGDPELLDELLGVFLEEGPALLQQIHDGLGTSDATLVRRASHTLKGSLRIFQASGGVELAFQLEKLGQQEELSRAAGLLDELEAYMAKLTVELKNRLNQ